jgi:hypothetical protein
MYNCIRLWDTILADKNRFEFLNFLCAAITLSCRDAIVKGNFADIMESLQDASSKYNDVSTLIFQAATLRNTYQQKIALL